VALSRSIGSLSNDGRHHDYVCTCVYDEIVAERIRDNFFIEPVQRDGLRRVNERDGISESEQIRRAIDQWLESRGVLKKAARRRAATRRKAWSVNRCSRSRGLPVILREPPGRETPVKAGIYARVSTLDQKPEISLLNFAATV
jgi:hypothetical protein